MSKDDYDQEVKTELSETSVVDAEVIKGDICTQCDFRCIQGCT